MNAEIIIEIDETGHILLPEKMREAFGWRTATKLAVTRNGRHMVLKTYMGCCYRCGNEKHNHFIWGKVVCDKCINELSKLQP